MVKQQGDVRTRSVLRSECKHLRPCARLFGRRFINLGGGSKIPWRTTEAAELVEFALLLPMLLVMIIGILDFATAYNLQQKLANAAREGARMASAQPDDDLTTTSPASIETVKDDVVTYLQQAGVDTSFISPTMTYDPTTYTATFYTTSGGKSYGLKIERKVKIYDPNNTLMPSTRVTLTYPYDWTYGFNHIIQLLIPSAATATQIGIETDATMVNLQ